MSDLAFFLRENRHIFSVCPKCGMVHRLSELQLARRGRYKPDWLDELERSRQRWETRESNLVDRKHELQAAARERAERRELPRLLSRVAPVFTRWRIDPRDVRTLFDPVEFVVFRGMNSENGVQDVLFLQLHVRDRLSRSLERAIKRKSFDWNTIRLMDDGSITEED